MNQEVKTMWDLFALAIACGILIGLLWLRDGINGEW